MAALDVTKGGSQDDADGGVVNWWRPREPSTCRSFAIAWFPGRSSGMARLEAASSTLELRDQRRSNVAMCPSLCVCVGMVAELELGHLTPIMRLRTTVPAVWATQVTYLVNPMCLTAATSASECHPAIRTIPRRGGVLHRKGDRDVGRNAFLVRSFVL